MTKVSGFGNYTTKTASVMSKNFSALTKLWMFVKERIFFLRFSFFSLIANFLKIRILSIKNLAKSSESKVKLRCKIKVINECTKKKLRKSFTILNYLQFCPGVVSLDASTEPRYQWLVNSKRTLIAMSDIYFSHRNRET